MSIDESVPAEVRVPVQTQRVSLSRWVNEGLPSCYELLTAHEVARLARRASWVLVAMSLMGQFPRKQRFHGRRVGWSRRDVMLWLGFDGDPGARAPTTRKVGREPIQQKLNLRCRRAWQFGTPHPRCSPFRRVKREPKRVPARLGSSTGDDRESALPSRRKMTSYTTSE
jgi:predicted DNA-binding transcriptional regulator AlpA